jgi:hypothetical protein
MSCRNCDALLRAGLLETGERCLVCNEKDAALYRLIRDLPSRAAEISIGTVLGEGPCILQREALDAALQKLMQQGESNAT